MTAMPPQAAEAAVWHPLQAGGAVVVMPQGADFVFATWVPEPWEGAMTDGQCWAMPMCSHMWGENHFEQHQQHGDRLHEGVVTFETEDHAEGSGHSTVATSEELASSDDDAVGPAASSTAASASGGRRKACGVSCEDSTDAAAQAAGKKLSHGCVPKGTDFSSRSRSSRAAVAGTEGGDREATTLMVRNIPNAYTRGMLVDEMEFLGFSFEYDFLYLPIDRSTQWNVGYAFVNFVSAAAARRCREAMAGYTFRCYPHGSGKVTQVSVAHLQGLDANLEYYSKTAVQCAGSEATRPLLLRGGVYIPAPSGTSSRAPRRRRQQRHQRAAASAR